MCRSFLSWELGQCEPYNVLALARDAVRQSRRSPPWHWSRRLAYSLLPETPLNLLWPPPRSLVSPKTIGSYADLWARWRQPPASRPSGQLTSVPRHRCSRVCKPAQPVIHCFGCEEPSGCGCRCQRLEGDCRQCNLELPCRCGVWVGAWGGGGQWAAPFSCHHCLQPLNSPRCTHTRIILHACECLPNHEHTVNLCDVSLLVACSLPHPHRHRHSPRPQAVPHSQCCSLQGQGHQPQGRRERVCD